MNPEELRRQAVHFRQLARCITDDRAYEAAVRLAREYDELADTVAHDGAPDGRQDNNAARNGA